MMRFWGTRKIRGVLSLLITIASILLTVSGRMEPPAVAQTPAASGAGSALIGTLEGPEVITDPAQFPKKFSEAPQLAALVKAGKLPPVPERIGQDPLVIKPVHEIGKYGGYGVVASPDRPTSGTAYTPSQGLITSCFGTTPGTRRFPTSPRLGS